MTSTERSLALCICTANRPKLLRRCLDSIFAGSVIPHQVVVSDDSLDPRESRRVCARFPLVEYRPGPRRGLCANRNAAVSHCRTSHVSFLDDDAQVTGHFVDQAKREIEWLDGHTLLTGDVIESGDRSAPTNTSFLGFFGAAPQAGLRNINLNASVFPRRALEDSGFDERIVYGYEDADLCAELIAGGYAIEHVPGLVARHDPPVRGAGQEEHVRRESTRARFYVTLKRYLLLERRIGAALAFLLLAPASELVVWTRRRKPRRGLTAIPDLAWALRSLLDYARSASGPFRRTASDRPARS